MLANERLVLALDVPTIAEARELYRETQGVISFFKIGMELLFSDPGSLISEIKDNGDRLFLDYKLSDIERTVEAGVKSIVRMGADVISIHAEEAALRGAINGRGDSPLKIWAITLLSSMDDSDVVRMGMASDPDQLVAIRTRRAIELGCDGVVSSGRSIEVAKAEIAKGAVPGKQFTLSVPGIRPSGSDWNDQKRVVTPKQAISSGADYLIVGRPIIGAKDRKAAARMIVREIEDAVQGV